MRPVYLGVMGGPKVGKSHFATTLFTSKLFSPERVLYLDNHGSTDTVTLPQYTKDSRWGVKHIAADEPQKLVEELDEVRKACVRGRQPFDAIVIDDWSEFAQADIEERLEDASDATIIRHWRDHGEIMRDAARLVHPRVTGAHHLAIFQVAQLPDPLLARPKKVENGILKFTADTRPTFLQPFLQGGFASWFPYKLDAVFYQYIKQIGGRIEFKMRFVPRGDIHVISRFLHLWVENPRLSQEMTNPTFDRVWALLQGETPAVETQEVEGGDNDTSE